MRPEFLAEQTAKAIRDVVAPLKLEIKAA